MTSRIALHHLLLPCALAAGLAACGGRTTPSTPGAPCVTSAPDLVRALGAAATARDWTAWRAHLSTRIVGRFPVDAEADIIERVLSTWARELASVDPAAATVRDDGLATWVVAPGPGREPEAVMKIAIEGECLRLDEN